MQIHTAALKEISTGHLQRCAEVECSSRPALAQQLL